LKSRTKSILTRVVLTLFLFSLFLSPSFGLMTPKPTSAEANPNLIQNPGFENSLAGWTFTDGLTGQAKIVTPDNLTSADKKSGTYSFKSTVEAPKTGEHASFDRLVSQMTAIDPAKHYTLSVWAKSSSTKRPLKLSWKEYSDNSKNSFLGDNSNLYLTPVTLSADWQIYNFYAKAQNPKTQYVQLYVDLNYYNPNDTTLSSAANTMWIDDLNLSEQAEYLSKYGCTNDSTSKCFDVGNPGEKIKPIPGAGDTSLNMIEDDSSGGSGAQLSPSIQFSDSKPDSSDGTTYREQIPYDKDNSKVHAWAYVQFPAFDVDSNGFPNNSIVLEIRYKDTINSITADAPLNNDSHTHRAIVTTQLNYDSAKTPKEEYQTNDLAELGLGNIGSGTWRYDQALYAKNDFQQVRAFNGYFKFRIMMPNNTDADKLLTLPIDYISLHTLSPTETTAYQQFQRDSKGYREVEPAIGDSPTNLSYYSTSTTEVIYKNTRPDKSRYDQPIQTFGTLGETVNQDLTLLSKSDYGGNSFSLNDLTLGGQATADTSHKIPSGNISLKQIVYDYRMQSVTPGANSTYSLMPDRIESVDKFDLKAGENSLFLLSIKVPVDLSSGTFSGTLDLHNGDKIVNIPINIDVLAMTLSDPTDTNLIYRSPFSTDMPSNLDDSLNQKAIGDNGIQAIQNMTSEDFGITANGNSVSFNLDKFKSMLATKKANGEIKDNLFLLDYYNQADKIIAAHNTLYPNSTWNNYDNADFRAAFSDLTRQIIQAASSPDLGLKSYFAITDEPTNNPTRRMQWAALAPLVQTAGGKTWAAWSSYCEQSAGVYPPLAPSLANPKLPDLVDYKIFGMGQITTAQLAKYPNGFGYYTTGVASMRDMTYNRFLLGLFAAKTKPQFILNYAYDAYEGDPYNDFDSNYNKIFPTTWRDHLLTLPSWKDTVVPTTSWIGISEGIRDEKYISTLEQLIAQNPGSNDATDAQNYLNSILSRISDNWTSDYLHQPGDYGFAGKITTDLASTDQTTFDSVRAQVFSHIKKLFKLNLVVTADRLVVASGGKITYTVTYKNSGTVSKAGLNISIPVPSGTTYDDGSATQSGTFANNSLSWLVANLDAGQSFSAQFKVKVQ